MKRTLTKHDKTLFAIIIVAVVAFAYYYFVFNPITNQINEQETRSREIEQELFVIKSYGGALENTLTAQSTALEGIDEIINTYYPYVKPQYYVDLLRSFSDDLDLTIAAITAAPQGPHELSGLIPENQRHKDDSLLDALSGYDELMKQQIEIEQNYDPEERPGSLTLNTVAVTLVDGNLDQFIRLVNPAVRPGSVILTTIAISLLDGNLDQYLNFLEKVNTTGYPIYVSDYSLSVTNINEVTQMEMDLIIMVIHVDRLTPSQYIRDAADFTFEPYPPANSKDNFRTLS